MWDFDEDGLYKIVLTAGGCSILLILLVGIASIVAIATVNIMTAFLGG